MTATNTNGNLIPSRIEALRMLMFAEGISAIMVPTSDYHNSEYVDDHFKCREYLSGFTGSNGTLVVMQDFAGLWTDGRYFLQAERELEGSGICLCRVGEAGVPKIIDFLYDSIPEGGVLAFDGRTIPAKQGIEYESKLAQKGISLRHYTDWIDKIWTDRPLLPCSQAYILDLKYAGESAVSKINRVRKEIKSGVGGLFFSKLDDICWLLNIRGADVECNPVVLSFLYLTDSKIHLFIQECELNEEVRTYLTETGVSLHSYEAIDSFAYGYKNIRVDGRVGIDIDNISFALYKSFSTNAGVVEVNNIIEQYKAVKNETELANLRETYRLDSGVLTRFICWLKKNINTESNLSITEIDASNKLDSMRGEVPGFVELSFPTISAYGENAASPHYEASEENNAVIRPKGMYLVDSGGQYMGGTTDVTRTIVLGEVTAEEKVHFTLTVIGMLRLANVRFLEGCTGRNLDILAREEMWKRGLDFKHGTGHGIGYLLNVHEGPANIRWRYMPSSPESKLLPGMIISDEPGLYIAGSHGIRTENICEVTPWIKNEYGTFLGFSHLTMVPIDLDGIELTLLNADDRKALNDYHALVRKNIYDLMTTDEEREWLEEATRQI